MYDEAIKIDPKYVDAYNGKGSKININIIIGISLNYLQKYQEAIVIYDEAIKIDPKYVDAYKGKGSKININIIIGISLNNLQKY